MEKISLIYDIKTIERFLQLFFTNAPLSNTECYFMSLSCRTKWLGEDRKEYSLSGTSQMFERKLIKEQSISAFLETLERYEYIASTCVDKNKKHIPPKGFGVYLNINPSNMIKAYFEFNSHMNQLLQEINMNLFENKKCDRLLDDFKNLDHVLKSKFQSCRTHKYFIDIDFDTGENFEPVQELIDSLKINDCAFLPIKTTSGYHVLLIRDTIKYDFHEIVQNIQAKYKKEICINKNEMIPFPGTFCGGKPIIPIF
jgi:hypothetical protein